MGRMLCGWMDLLLAPGTGDPVGGLQGVTAGGAAGSLSRRRGVAASQASWGWGCHLNEAGIARGMSLGLQPRWIKDCNADGPSVATLMGLGLQQEWVWDCKPDGSGIGTQTSLGLRPRWTRDCKPSGSGIAIRMGLGLQAG